jgi:hypothetical protein
MASMVPSNKLSLSLTRSYIIMRLVIRTIDLPKDTFRRKTVEVADINEAHDVALEYVSQWREDTASLAAFNLYENDDNVAVAVVVVHD